MPEWLPVYTAEAEFLANGAQKWAPFFYLIVSNLENAGRVC